MSFKRSVIFSFLCLLISVGTSAQNPRGSLSGTVSDTSGGRIASAKVIIKSVGAALERTATSDSRGEFRVDDLLPGPYRVTVNAPGMNEVQSDVTVAVSVV